MGLRHLLVPSIGLSKILMLPVKVYSHKTYSATVGARLVLLNLQV